MISNLRSISGIISTFRANLSPLTMRTGLAFSAALIGILGHAAPSLAATITVSGTCDLRDAITSANMNTATGGCVAGDAGIDTISIPAGTITVTGTALPEITEPVILDGAGQTTTIVDYNGLPGPGFFLRQGAAGSTIQDLTIRRVGDDGSQSGTGANIRIKASNVTIDNIISELSTGDERDGLGIFFDASSAASGNPPASSTFGQRPVNGSVVRNSIIQDNDNGGISLRFGATGVTIESNIVQRNGQDNDASDGIEVVLASGGNIIQSNQILNNQGYGIDLRGNSAFPSDGNIIRNNLIQNNGAGTSNQDGGIGVRFATNTLITRNVISGNDDDGVVVINNSVGNQIIENSIFNNGAAGADGQLAIDLGGTETGNGVTSNDNGDGDATGDDNDLYNFPIFEAAIVANDRLILPGFARPGSTIELFVVTTPDNNNFGEAEFYLETLTEGSGDDTNALTGTYDTATTTTAYGATTAARLGTDTTNQFFFNRPLPTLQTRLTETAAGVPTPPTFTPGARNGTALEIGDAITATATATAANTSGATVGSTSELSGLVTITAGIGVSKRVISITPVGTTQFDVVFQVTIENLSPVPLANVQVTDNLTNTFINAGATDFDVQSPPAAPATPPPALTQGTGTAATPNTGFDGTNGSDINLLNAGATLGALALGSGTPSAITVEYTVRVTPGTQLNYENTATGTAEIQDSGGNPLATLTDDSNDGTEVTDTGTTDPTTTANNTPTPITFGLELVKRITRVVQSGTTEDFTTPTGSPPDASFVGVETPPAPFNELTSGDQVEYTIYYINRTSAAITAVSICDPVPANSSFVTDGFAAGQGVAYASPAAALGAAVNQTNVSGDDDGAFLAALTANGACPSGNAGTLGAAFVDVGTVDVDELGLVRFVTTVD